MQNSVALVKDSVVPATRSKTAPVAVAVLASLVAFGALLLLADEAEASHLRGGTLAWKVESPVLGVGGGASGWTVNVTGQYFIRSNYYGAPFNNPPVGTVDCGQTDFNGMDFGDGTPPQQICVRVTYQDLANNWMILEIGRQSGVSGFLPGMHHDYTVSPAGQTFIAWHDMSARLSAPHMNNANANQRTETAVALPSPTLNAPANDSPRVFMPPIIDCPINQVCYIPILAIDPENDPMSYRWATAPEAVGGAAAWNQLGPNPATINTAAPGGPRIEWDTTGAQMSSPCNTFHSAQLMTTTANGAKVPMDWFINLCNAPPPFWLDPPSACSHLGHGPLLWPAGVANSYTVRAAHNTTNVQMFRSPLTSLPPGASESFTGLGNPTSSTVTWTPPPSETGNTYAVTYYAYAGSAYAPTCTVQVTIVSDPPVASFSCATQTNPYLRVVFQDFSTDPDGNLASWSWDFGDGGTSTLPNPSHDYPAEGWYTVTLTVADSTGQTDSTTQQCFAENNLPPIIDPIPVQVVYEGEEVRFVVTGRDQDEPQHNTWFTWVPGPLGSKQGVRFAQGVNSFGGNAFQWQTQKGDAGIYQGTEFRIHDWEFSSATGLIVIVLQPAPPTPPGNADSDGDQVPDNQDNCPYVSNPGQEDSNGDGIGDACNFLAGKEINGPTPDNTSGGDPPSGPGGDDPLAGIDTDGDGVLDIWDNCIQIVNPDQDDGDRDGIGDACDDDWDNDLVLNVGSDGLALDNCPWAANPDQKDSDGDGVGDACQGDRDSDGRLDGDDACPLNPSATCKPMAGLPSGMRPGSSVGEPVGSPQETDSKAFAWWLVGVGAVLVAAAVVGVVFLARRRPE